jgi:hypothetical protein
MAKERKKSGGTEEFARTGKGPDLTSANNNNAGATGKTA